MRRGAHKNFPSSRGLVLLSSATKILREEILSSVMYWRLLHPHFNGLEGVTTFSHLLRLIFINLCVIFQPGSSRNTKNLLFFCHNYLCQGMLPGFG